jgi:hypothetical protein
VASALIFSEAGTTGVSPAFQLRRGAVLGRLHGGVAVVAGGQRQCGGDEGGALQQAHGGLVREMGVRVHRASPASVV